MRDGGSAAPTRAPLPPAAPARWAWSGRVVPARLLVRFSSTVSPRVGTPYLARTCRFMTRYSCPSLPCGSIPPCICGCVFFPEPLRAPPPRCAPFSHSPVRPRCWGTDRGPLVLAPGLACAPRAMEAQFTSVHMLLDGEHTLTLTSECVFIHAVLP